MLFAMLKKLQKYAIFMLKVIIFAALCSHLPNNGSCKISGEFFYRRCTEYKQLNAPSDLATTVTDCKGLDMLSRES